MTCLFETRQTDSLLVAVWEIGHEARIATAPIRAGRTTKGPLSVGCRLGVKRRHRPGVRPECRLWAKDPARRIASGSPAQIFNILEVDNHDAAGRLQDAKKDFRSPAKHGKQHESSARNTTHNRKERSSGRDTLLRCGSKFSLVVVRVLRRFLRVMCSQSRNGTRTKVRSKVRGLGATDLRS